MGRNELRSFCLLQVSRLAGVKVLGLSMGYGHTLLIAQNDTPEQIAKLETFDVFEP
jgi:hypothetical protein